LNRKKASIIVVLLLATIMGVVSARGAFGNSPSPILTSHVAGVDIEILNVVPTLTFQSNSLGVASTGIAVSRGLSGFPGPQNLTTGFSFAPIKGFASIDSVSLTVVQFASSVSANGFIVELNGHTPVILPGSSAQNTVFGSLNRQDLREGANRLNLGINLDGSSGSGGTFVYHVHMTVEYTYLSAD
jgi:hypothetical protein